MAGPIFRCVRPEEFDEYVTCYRPVARLDGEVDQEGKLFSGPQAKQAPRPDRADGELRTA